MVWSRMQVARKDSLYVVQKRDDINAKIIALQVQSNMFALLAQFPYIFMLVVQLKHKKRFSAKDIIYYT